MRTGRSVRAGERFERTNRLLLDRIEYHRRKLEEERAARGEA